MNNAYQSKRTRISGTSFKEIEKNALTIFKTIKRKTKRTPYVRSKYFRKEKVFLSIFWGHLYEKSEKDKTRRLKLFDCALDLIQNSTRNPTTRENFQKKDELLHRFHGETKHNEKFTVQIKENKRTKRKDFVSVYPN